MVRRLDANLTHFAAEIEHQLGRALARMPGAGSAGGLGAAMVAVLDATLRPGVEIVMDALGLDGIVADADLVITGEGRIDSQSIRGKTPVGVARVAKRHGKPAVAIAGCLTPDVGVVHAYGIDAVFSILSRPCSVAEALAEAADNCGAQRRGSDGAITEMN